MALPEPPSWTYQSVGCTVDQYACGTRVPTSLTSTLLSQNPQCPTARPADRDFRREIGA
ncbi:hypothetical protein ACFOLD_14330 [Kocuria carniphila]|uniref:hypothetical protein n=1 Tax=Kocuria carniphila TaxID=262208 RepID=UPI00360E634E